MQRTSRSTLTLPFALSKANETTKPQCTMYYTVVLQLIIIIREESIRFYNQMFTSLHHFVWIHLNRL